VKWGQKNDFPYGLDIYALPIQKLVALSIPEAAFAAHLFLAIIFTFPFAELSWFSVKRPAIRSIKRLLGKFAKQSETTCRLVCG